MYDSFSEDYDRFVNWPSRLSAEMPFIQQQLQSVRRARSAVTHVLDAACGTGMHAIALAKSGFTVAGADLSWGMIQKARLNAQEEEMDVRFEAAGFGGLENVFGRETFDSLLCLGNSLPHILSTEALATTLADFAACLRPGGLLLVQNRNFDAVLAQQERWMEPQTHHEGDVERVFVRFYDFRPDGLLNFNILTLRREGQASWTQSAVETLLRPLRQVELAQALTVAGFREMTWYGDMAGAPYEPDSSGNLIVSAIKKR